MTTAMTYIVQMASNRSPLPKLTHTIHPPLTPPRFVGSPTSPFPRYAKHCSRNLPIHRLIFRFIANRRVTDMIMPYLCRLSFGPIYHSDKRFIGNLPINQTYSSHYVGKNYLYLCFVDLVTEYVLLPYFFCHFTRIQRLEIKVTLLSNIVLVLNIAYFSVGNLRFAKKYPINSRSIKSINQLISD